MTAISRALTPKPDRPVEPIALLVIQDIHTMDLIPFAGIEASPNTTAWPSDMAAMMSVAGFGDALAATLSVEVSPRIEIAVASLPGIAILKLFAWADRGQENPKDAIDLVLLLRNYGDAGNTSRIFEEASALAALEAAGYDLELELSESGYRAPNQLPSSTPRGATKNCGDTHSL